MLKVGIITLNGYFNYGNRLQNYALQKFLKNINANIYPETVLYEKFNLKLEEKLTRYVNIRNYILNKNGFREFINSGKYKLDIIREYNFKRFNDKYINSCFDYKIKDDLNDRYDYFIAGSDQIWNPYYVNLKNEFLQFADRNKRIAYAASFGVSQIKPDKINEVKKGLEGIDFISVREQAGAKIVKELTGKEVPVLVDPTLLLTAEEWEKVMERPTWYRDEKYILTYFLSDIPVKVQNDIIKLSDLYKLKVIDLANNENIDYFCSPPE